MIQNFPNLYFSACTIVRDAQDRVSLTISRTDQFGHPTHPNLHGQHEDYNTRELVISTIRGNGPHLARKLGWVGKILVIGSSGRHAKIEDWDLECSEQTIDAEEVKKWKDEGLEAVKGL